jgi:acyl-coenzyme A synthetase/AMP-(fatty) acid ligase
MNVTAEITRQARQNPHAIAITTPKLQLTYHQLEEAACRAAVQFDVEGVHPGDLIGISVPGSVLHLVASLGLAKLGAAHVAMPLTDPVAFRQELATRLCLSAVVGEGPDAASAGPTLLSPNPEWLEVSQAKKMDRPPIHIDAEAPWLILRSSGTTGEPKFAALSHPAAMKRIERASSLYPSTQGDRFWTPSALDFAVAKQRTLFNLCSGVTVCFTDGLRSENLFEFLSAQGVSYVTGTPSHLHWLLSSEAALRFVRTLRVMEVRSATVTEALRRRFKRECPNLYIIYATNETEAVTMATPELQAGVADTVGLPVPSLAVEVVDQKGRSLPEGEIGEIRVRGPGVISSYLNNPEATAKAFRGGWFHPGDFGSFTSDGALLLHGRTDDMMIVDGINVYPAEIENTLLRHPAVAEAAAFPLRSPVHQDVPFAAVVLKTPSSNEELLRFCREHLGVRTPRGLLSLSALPRNAAGKVVKRALAQHVEAELSKAEATRSRADKGS